MKDEIKEILDRLFVYRNENNEMKYQPEDILTIEDVWLLLDYIINLQETYQNAIKQSIIDHKYASKKEDEVIVLQEENKRLKGEIKTLENNCQQAENSCRQHRLANKNHIRRLKRREKQINLYKSRNEKAIHRIQLLQMDGEVNIKDLGLIIEDLRGEINENN